MLEITIPKTELYDESTQSFITVKEQKLQLEHSLVSVSKWESKWRKPFIGSTAKTIQEGVDYVRCMTITQNVDPLVYGNITQALFEQVNAYIELPMTATTFNDNNHRPSREVITAEIIYHWMIVHHIPVDFQKWHLNKLLALIRVCSIKNAPEKKMGRKALMERNRALNASRQKALNTRG